MVETYKSMARAAASFPGEKSLDMTYAFFRKTAYVFPEKGRT